MSHTSVKQPSSTRTPSLEGLVDIGFELLSMSIENVRTLVQRLPTVLPAPDLTFLRPKDPCAIPEVECPPRCVCEVTWEASPGETLDLTVRMTNSSNCRRTFDFVATPFVGADKSPGTISLNPTKLMLAAGGSGTVNARFVVPNVPEGDYHAEIVVSGAYEQCVRVTLRVQCKKTCGDECCTCEIVQGNPPVRIRAHHWYHHFQCTVPCADQPCEPSHRDQ